MLGLSLITSTSSNSSVLTASVSLLRFVLNSYWLHHCGRRWWVLLARWWCVTFWFLEWTVRPSDLATVSRCSWLFSHYTFLCYIWAVCTSAIGPISTIAWLLVRAPSLRLSFCILTSLLGCKLLSKLLQLVKVFLQEKLVLEDSWEKSVEMATQLCSLLIILAVDKLLNFSAKAV